MPRGQASVQLKIVRQRQTPSLSLRISRRMSPPASRESKMKRCALTMAAGPKYCPSVQKTRHTRFYTPYPISASSSVRPSDAFGYQHQRLGHDFGHGIYGSRSGGPQHEPTKTAKG